MALTVYVLCAVTSLLCTALLARGYSRSRVKLLLWSALCFAGLTLNNVLLLIDRLHPGIDLTLVRTIPALVGVSLLLWGLVRDTA